MRIFWGDISWRNKNLHLRDIRENPNNSLYNCYKSFLASTLHRYMYVNLIYIKGQEEKPECKFPGVRLAAPQRRVEWRLICVQAAMPRYSLACWGGGDVIRVEGVDRVEGGGGGAIMTECTQKSGA
jgi:hypothetical protein